jgi:hypothetical protein
MLLKSIQSFSFISKFLLHQLEHELLPGLRVGITACDDLSYDPSQTLIKTSHYDEKQMKNK